MTHHASLLQGSPCMAIPLRRRKAVLCEFPPSPPRAGGTAVRGLRPLRVAEEAAS